MGEPNHDDAPLAFSLIRGDPLFRLQQAVGLIGHHGGLGVVRRAVLIAGISWLPLVVWAIATGRALGHTVAEPLFEHFGVHVRSLVAISLLVIADATTQTMLNRVIPYFITSVSSTNRHGRATKRCVAMWLVCANIGFPG